MKDRVNVLTLPPVEDIRRDSDLFLEGTLNPEFQERMQSAMRLGCQSRDGEMNLAKLLADLGRKRDV